MRLVAAALALLTSFSLALAQNTGGNPLVPGGGGGGGGGPSSITFTTSCPSSTQTGSTINYINGINAVAKTASYALVSGDCGTTFDVSGTGVTMTMPTLAAGYVVAFKNTNASGGANVTISAGAGQTIDGASTYTVAPLQYVQISASTTGTNYDAGTGAAGSNIPTNLGYTSGTYYPSGLNFAPAITGSAWGTAGMLSCSPYFVSPPGMTIKAIGFGVITADTTPNYASAAIYTNGSNQLPNTLIDSIGSTAISLATTGAKSGTVANTTDTLPPGWIWTCAASNSTTGVMYGVPLSTSASIGGANAVLAIGGGNSAPLGISCTGTGTSTCPGPTWGSGGGSGYVWPASLSGATWTTRTVGSLVPAIALQVN